MVLCGPYSRQRVGHECAVSYRTQLRQRQKFGSRRIGQRLVAAAQSRGAADAASQTRSRTPPGMSGHDLAAPLRGLVSELTSGNSPRGHLFPQALRRIIFGKPCGVACGPS